MDNDLKQAVDADEVAPQAQAEEETAETESAPVDQTESTQGSDELDETEATAKVESGEELSDDDISHLSRKAQKRIRRLADENKAMREQLRVGLDGLTATPPYVQAQSQESSLPWDQQTEITVDDYEKAVVSKADAIARARIAEYESRQQLREDISQVKANYPELDPNSGEFDNDLANKVSAHYQRIAKAEPNARLVDFVEDIMSIREKAVEEGRTVTTAKVVAQAAQQAISPTSEGASSKVAESEALFEEAKESGSDKAWAEYFKRTMPLPE